MELKYKHKNLQMNDEEDVEEKELTKDQIMKGISSEGAYTIRTEWEGPNNTQMAH